MAEAESSATASKRSRQPFPETLSESIHAAVVRLAQHKARSLEYARRHLMTVEENGHKMTVALLGDSMLERMETTGEWENLQSWPSETMASDSAIQAMNDAIDDTDATTISRIQGVASFGCGGDKIQNILYRVVGDPDTNLKGLAQELQTQNAGNLLTRRNLKLWVIQAGTNNLHRKHGLRATDSRAMDILLRTLHQLSHPGTKFLVTGVFYRRDIPNELVDRANDALQSLIDRLDQEYPGTPEPTEENQDRQRRNAFSHNRDDSGIGGVSSSKTIEQSHTSPFKDRDNGIFTFLPAPRIDEFSEWLEDNVHLHKEGYQKWMQTLLPKVHGMLRKSPRQPTAPPQQPSPPRSPTSLPRTPSPLPEGSHFRGVDEVRRFYATDAVKDMQEVST